jgi:hypothetical protein
LLIEVTNAAAPDEESPQDGDRNAGQEQGPPTINTSFDSGSGGSAPPTGAKSSVFDQVSSSSASGPDSVSTRRGTDEDDPLDDQEFNSLILSLSPTNFDGLGSQTKTVAYTPAQRNSYPTPSTTTFTPSRIGKVDSRGRVLDEEALVQDITSTDARSNSSYAVVDLNKAPQIVVDKVKEHMTLQFSANQLRPGDEGYVYDVQKDFTVAPGEAEENDWDEDD